MPKTGPCHLPESLRYLQPFINSLARRRPADLNEDIDPSRLERALRKRLNGMDEHAAEEAIQSDCDMLRTWLSSQPDDHAAHWVLGFLSLPGLAGQLGHPPEEEPRSPVIQIDPPAGWKVSAVPFQLHLKKRKLLAVITALDALSFDSARYQARQAARRTGVQTGGHADATWTTVASKVAFGPWKGHKQVAYVSTPHGRWKKASYVLSSCGNGVTVVLQGAADDDFDESILEAQLETLRLHFPGEQR